MLFAYLLLVLLMLGAALATIRAKSLIHAAVSLAIGNSSLALLFFLLQAPYAGSVQLSVGAGMVSVLFIIAITLAESAGGRTHDD